MTEAGKTSRRTFLLGGAALAAGLVAANCTRRGAATTTHADTVFTGGNVVTVDDRLPRARAVAVSGDRIVFVGSDADVKSFIGPRTDVVNLSGRMLMPGIHDGHTHPIYGGRGLTNCNLDAKPLKLDAFLEKIEMCLQQTRDLEPDGWLEVDGWEAIGMPGPLPTAADLDRLQTQRPVLVNSLDGHIAVANSRALAIGEVTKTTRDPADGEIVRDAGGEPNGRLYDGAMNLVADRIPQPTLRERQVALEAAFAEMTKRGITSFMDAYGVPSMFEGLAAVHRDGNLKLRAQMAVYVKPKELEDPVALLEHLERVRKDVEAPGIRVPTVKLFYDGVIEYPTQTAALLEPYLENSGTRRQPRWSSSGSRGPTYVENGAAFPAIAALDASGWQVHVHAIGDRATRSALDAFEHARGINGDRGNRHTITHLELVDPVDFDRFAKLGVVANMQMQWAERDAYTVDRLRPNLGDNRWKHLYPAGSLARSGATLSGGSDWPVDPLLPLRQIEFAVNRTADEIYPGDPEPLFGNQALSLEESIRIHTLNSAYQLHQEEETGSITRGKLADLILTERDLFEIPLEEVSKTEVLLTMIGGEPVYRSDDL